MSATSYDATTPIIFDIRRFHARYDADIGDVTPRRPSRLMAMMTAATPSDAPGRRDI